MMVAIIEFEILAIRDINRQWLTRMDESGKGIGNSPRLYVPTPGLLRNAMLWISRLIQAPDSICAAPSLGNRILGKAIDLDVEKQLVRDRG